MPSHSSALKLVLASVTKQKVRRSKLGFGARKKILIKKIDLTIA